MATLTQPLLFPEEPHANLLAAVKARLGVRELVRPSDVAAACNVSLSTVYDWIEEGVIEATNVASREKPFWQVFAPSVIRFYADPDAVRKAKRSKT